MQFTKCCTSLRIEEVTHSVVECSIKGTSQDTLPYLPHHLEGSVDLRTVEKTRSGFEARKSTKIDPFVPKSCNSSVQGESVVVQKAKIPRAPFKNFSVPTALSSTSLILLSRNLVVTA